MGVSDSADKKLVGRASVTRRALIAVYQFVPAGHSLLNMTFIDFMDFWTLFNTFSTLLDRISIFECRGISIFPKWTLSFGHDFYRLFLVVER